MTDAVTTFSLDIEPPLPLAKAHEVDLLRKAVAGNPSSLTLRGRLASLHFIQDRFDEAIALYQKLWDEAPSAHWATMLAECHISKETPEDDRTAERMARLALPLAVEPRDRAQLLAVLGKALVRQGRHEEARTTLMEALESDPSNANAYKRLAALDLASGSTASALVTADHLIGQGVAHSRVLAGKVLALVGQGRFDEARKVVDLERFLHRSHLAAPAGWPDLASLNRDVRNELERHPDIRFDRYGTASSKTWRVDQPAFASSVAIPALQALIQQAVIDHVKRLDQEESAWVQGRPARGILHNWCVITEGDGYEEWHVHQNGWMSGVYYVDVPDSVTSGSGPGGCIAFGLPEDLVGDTAAREFGQTLVRPEAGLMMLFPSHTYHRTFPHHGDGRRICLAFDILRG